MANYVIDPVTGIKTPTPLQDPGSDYAVNVSDALTKLSSLTHTGASNQDGYQIPAAGINFNGDISAQTHNLTNLKSTRYVSQDAPLSGVGDINCLFFSSGNAYVNDANGNHIKLTNGGVVNATVSSNLTSTAISTNLSINPSATYAVINVDCTAGTILITLPTAASIPSGRFYYVKDVLGQSATHNITIQTAGDTMDAGTTFVLKHAYQAVLLVCDGAGNFSVYPFNKLSVESGETFTVSGTETIESAGVLEVKSGGELRIDSGGTVNLTGTENVKSGGIVEYKSGSQLILDTGTTTAIHTPLTLSFSGNIHADSNREIIQVRNAANSADVNLISTNNSDVAHFGNTTTTNTNVDGYNYVQLNVGNTSLNMQSVGGGLPLINFSGGVRVTASIKSSDYTCDSGSIPDHTILMNATGGSKIVTLPPVTVGRIITVIDYAGQAAAHTIQINPHVAETISGSAVKQITTNYGAMTFMADGTNWVVISNVT